MAALNWQVNSSSNFPSSLIVKTHNSPVNFNLIYFLLWIKLSHQSPNFEAFKCPCENFTNSLCHFWKHKSVFSQIFHQSSVQLNINPLYFLSPNIIYFGQKHPIKLKTFEILECSGQNSSNSSFVNFELTSQFLFKFSIILHSHDA